MAEFERNSPIRREWFEKDGHPEALFKELPGNKSLFNSHCGCRMRRVIGFVQRDGFINKLGFVGWVCEVCDIRKNALFD